MYKIGSLFSGIGSLDLGVIDALGGNAETVWFCESDPFCQKVLSKRFLGTPIYDDVTDLPRMKMTSPDILVGGFPCQDLSVAGHAKGIKEGTRSGLFLDMWELAAFYLHPRFVLFENVPAIRTRGLDVVADAITSCGWTLEWFCLSASSVGAWHKRERWWAIAHREEPLFDRYEDIGIKNDGTYLRSQLDLFNRQEVEMPKTGMARDEMLYCRESIVTSSENLWPTPTSMTGGTGVAPSHINGGHGWNLGAAVQDSMSNTPHRNWPTPTATDYKDGESPHSISQQVKRKGTGVRLGSYVPASENGLLPTPVRGDGHKLPSNSLSRYIESGGLKYSANDHRSTVDKIEWKPGKLNPDWVEPLMGLPSGYTDLDRSVDPEMLPVSSWRDGSWESGIDRLTEKKTDRVSRIQSLGNSVVPQCASAAFSILRRRLNE